MNLTILLQMEGGGIMGFIPMLLVLVIMYFFFIRPQMQKQKQQTEFQDAIKKGDEVVTTSGMIGKIDTVIGEEVTLQVDGKTYLRFLRGSISKELTEAHKKAQTKTA